MSSLSTSDGQYTLTVTFKIGTDGDKAQILVREPRVERARRAARERAEAGRADQQEFDVHPRDRGADLARRAATTACSCRTTRRSICSTRSRASTASAASPCSAPASTPSASGSIRRSCRRAGSCPQDVINAVNLQSRSTSAGQVGLPPVPQGQTFQYSINVHGKLDDVAEFEKIIVKTDTGGRITRLQDVGTRRARRAAVQPDLQARREAVGRHGDLSAPQRQRARRCQARRRRA